MELARVIVVMGVSGVGKTTFGQALAQRLGYRFEDADAYHPPANVAKMSAGIPLDDDDRRPWLMRLAELIDACLRERHEPTSRGLVLACSALRASYREMLRGSAHGDVSFIHLIARREVLAARLESRAGHFMKASLLDSQLTTLEAPQGALTLDSERPLTELVEVAVGALTAERAP